MHKRNITLIALVLAGIVTALFILVPALKQSETLGIFYLPTIALAVLLSGGSHSPTALAWWSGFIGYSVLYLILFVVIYAVLLEFYLTRQAFHQLDAVRDDIRRREARPDLYLRRLGAAISQLERHRRTHWVLDDRREFDLSGSPEDLAATALTTTPQWRPLRRLVGGMQSRIANELGKDAAAAEISKMKDHAHHARSSVRATR